MTQRGKWLLAASAVALVALLWSRQTLEPLSYYSSRSYVQRTNDLIHRGALAIEHQVGAAADGQRRGFGRHRDQQPVRG